MYFLPHKGNYDSTGGSKGKIKLIKILIQVGIFFENVKHALIHPDPLAEDATEGRFDSCFQWHQLYCLIPACEKEGGTLLQAEGGKKDM